MENGPSSLSGTGEGYALVERNYAFCCHSARRLMRSGMAFLPEAILAPNATLFPCLMPALHYSFLLAAGHGPRREKVSHVAALQPPIRSVQALVSFAGELRPFWGFPRDLHPTPHHTTAGRLFATDLIVIDNMRLLCIEKSGGNLDFLWRSRCKRKWREWERNWKGE